MFAGLPPTAANERPADLNPPQRHVQNAPFRAITPMMYDSQPASGPSESEDTDEDDMVESRSWSHLFRFISSIDARHCITSHIR